MRLRTREMRKCVLGFKLISDSIETPFSDSQCSDITNMPPRALEIPVILPSSHHLPPQLPGSCSSLENYLQFLEHASNFISSIPLEAQNWKGGAHCSQSRKGLNYTTLYSCKIPLFHEAYGLSVELIAISKYCLLLIYACKMKYNI